MRNVAFPLVLTLASLMSALPGLELEAVPRVVPSPIRGDVQPGGPDGVPSGQTSNSFTQNNNAIQNQTTDHCANKSKRSDPSPNPSQPKKDKEGSKGSGTNPGKEKCDCSQSNAFQPRADTTFLAANLFLNVESQVDNSTTKNCQSSGQFLSPLTNVSFNQVPGQSLSPGGCGSCGGGAPFIPSGSSNPSNLMPDLQLVEAPRDGVANAAFGDQSHTFDFRMVASRNASKAVFSLQVPGKGMIDHVFSTTDLTSFINEVHRGRKTGATMVGTPSHLILTTETGWTLQFPRPVSMDVVTSGMVLRAERVQPVGEPPIHLTYDGAGRLTSVQGPLGGYAFTYGPVLGRTLVTHVTAPDGRVLTTGYVKDGSAVRLASLTHPDGSVSSWGYTGRKVTFGPNYETTDIHREWRAVTPNFDYGRNRVVVQYRDKDCRITLAEDGEGRDLFYREANGISDGRLWRQFRNFTGNRTVWWHDGNANAVRVVGLDTGSDHQFLYDTQNRIIGAIDELGRSGTVSYFGKTQLLTSVHYPDGTSMVWNRREDGRITSVVDRLGRVTQVERDDGSRIDATTNPDGTVEGEDFNDWGQPIRTRDALGRETEYRYAMSGLPADAATSATAVDNRGYLVQVIQPADHPGGHRPVWTYHWDPVTKDCLRMTDPAGRTYEYTYDLLHRAVRIDFADGTHEALTYGAPTDPLTAGLVVAHRDRVGQVTTYDYDRSGLKIRETAPDGTVTRWSYDNTGKVRERVVRGDRETMAYDGAGRLVSRTAYPATDRPLTTRTIYDTRSEVVAVVDPFGRTTGTVYDINNRPVRTVQGLTPSAIDYHAVTTAPLDGLPWMPAVSTKHNRETVSATQSTPGSWTLSGRSAPLAQGSFSLVSTPMWTDGTLSATLAGMTGGRTWAKGGLIIRSTRSVTSPMLFIGRERNGKIWSFYRLSDSKTVTLTGPTISATAAVELTVTRSGRWHTASWREPGGSWQELAKVDLPTTAASEIGLAVDSDDLNSTVTATFTGVGLTRVGGLSPAAMAMAWERHLLGLNRDRTDLIITEAAYDQEGQLIAQTDGRGVVTTHLHDSQGRVVEVVEAAFTAQSATTAYRYDDEGNLTEVRTPRFFDPTDTTGASVARQVMTYTGRNQVASVTAAPGTVETATTTTIYTRTGKPLTTTDALGRTTTYQYDPCCDRLIKVTDPTGAVTEFRYDGEGRRVLMIDPNGLATVTAYDPRGRVSLVITALPMDAVPCCGGLPDVTAIVGGLRTQYTYDDGLADGIGLDAAIPGLTAGLGLGVGADGSAVAVTNPNGETTVQVMDGVGRTVRRIDPLGHVTTMVYDQVVDGLVTTTVSDPLGQTTTAAVDGAGRTLRTVDPLGYSSTAAYDANSNRVSWRDATGVGQDCGFDLRNRDVSCLDTTGASATRSFDLEGNLIAATDALGQTERHRYDARGRKIATTDRIGATTEFTYDAHGNLIRIRDAEGGETEYAYDERHLLVEEVFPKGQQGRTRKKYTYDPGRRLIARQVGIGVPGSFDAGKPVEGTTYAYDQANRLITRGYDDALADTFGYDDASRLTSAASARYQTSVSRAYDADGRLVSETQSHAQVGSWTVGYAYDPANRQIAVTYPDGSVVDRLFDDRAQLISATFAGSLVASRQWDAAGRLTRTGYGNGVVETRTYTPGDHTVATIKAIGPGGAAVTDFTYTYDALKRKTAEIDPILAGQTFGYDAQSRLTVWSATGGVLPAGPSAQTWDLSPVGNWRSTTIDGVSTTRAHTKVHEIDAIGQTPLAYDFKGNLAIDDRGQRYTWDPENRMTAAWVPAGPRSATDSRPAVGADARYVYDALGRRVAKVVNGMRTVFVHDGAQVITERIAPDTGAPAPAPAWNAPTSGGILTGMSTTGIPTAGQVLRINFQPAGIPVPAGFLADTGAASATRGALHFGWSWDQSHEAAVTHLAPSPEWDTFIETTASGAAWAIDLPNGTYPIAIVSGEAAFDGRTNAWILDGGAGPTVLLDQDPGTNGYPGDFDVWTTTVTVSNGRLQIRASGVSVRPSLCFLEIAAAGSTVPANAQGYGDYLAAQQVPTEAGLVDAEMAFAEVTKRFVYSTRYIDEPFLYTVNGTKYYVHQNHLFSVAAVTDAAGATRERYSYTSYGDRIVCAPTGAPLTNSQVNNEIGFTGYVCYPETSVNFARERVYGCAIGRFLSRDPLGYFDGVSLYGAYFIPNQLDPTGTKTEDHHWFAQKFSLLFQDICQIPIHEFTTTLDLEAHHYAHDILKYNQMLIRKLRKCIGAKVDCCCVVKTVQQHSKETAVNLSLRGHVPWGVQEAAGNRNSPSLGLPLHPYRNPNKNTESQWNRMQDICRENNCEKDVPRQIDLEGVMNEWYTNNPMHEVDPFSALYNNPGRYGISIPTVGLPARSGGRIPNVSPKSYPKIKTKKKECCPLQPDESIPYDQPRKTG